MRAMWLRRSLAVIPVESQGMLLARSTILLDLNVY